jgi:hypothetical protein
VNNSTASNSLRKDQNRVFKALCLPETGSFTLDSAVLLLIRESSLEYCKPTAHKARVEVRDISMSVAATAACQPALGLKMDQ